MQAKEIKEYSKCLQEAPDGTDDNEDGAVRFSTIIITDSGTDVVSEGYKIWSAVQETFRDVLGEENIISSHNILEKIDGLRYLGAEGDK